MTQWRSYFMFSSNLDSMILEFVQPFMDAHRDRLDRCFWERHSAGGPHLRIRFKGDPDALESVAAALRAEAKDYFEAHPSPDLESYSPANAAAFLEKEGAVYTEDDLVYRNNVIVERAFPPNPHGFESDEAANYMYDFHHDATHFVGAVLSDPRPNREIVLRLYFAHAALAVGNIPGGSVTWKSHWEGFRSSISSPVLIDRIKEAYDADREGIFAHLTEIETICETGDWRRDPILEEWKQLIDVYSARASREVRKGHSFTSQLQSPEQAAEARARAAESLERESSFVRTFWSDDRFLLSINKDVHFQVPRLLVNLFYGMIARVGLKPLDKMVLCHHVQRSVEEHFGVDLEKFLAANMAAVVKRQTGSSEAPAAG
ncbi:MAG: lantibiotic dehydratase C-terminal domain-containing protein [Acidobacteriota bacterium]